MAGLVGTSGEIGASRVENQRISNASSQGRGISRHGSIHNIRRTPTSPRRQGRRRSRAGGCASCHVRAQTGRRNRIPGGLHGSARFVRIVRAMPSSAALPAPWFRHTGSLGPMPPSSRRPSCRPPWPSGGRSSVPGSPAIEAMRSRSMFSTACSASPPVLRCRSDRASPSVCRREVRSRGRPLRTWPEHAHARRCGLRRARVRNRPHERSPLTAPGVHRAVVLRQPGLRGWTRWAMSSSAQNRGMPKAERDEAVRHDIELVGL